MIEFANRRLKETTIDNVHFLTLTDFGSNNNSKYHVVVLSYVLHLLDDPQILIRRASELLIPEGLIISSTVCLGEMNLLLRITMSLLTRVGLIPELSQFKGGELASMFVENHFEIIENINMKIGERFIVAKVNHC